MKRMLRGVLVGSGLLLVAALPQAVMAAMTEAGTEVSNTASVAYKVSNADQTPVTGNAKFLVDRKVALTVTYDGSAPVNVVPAQTQVGLKFTLTNLSNANLDFVLNAADVLASVDMGALGIDLKDTKASSLTIHADDGTGNAPAAGVLSNSRIVALSRDTGSGTANQVVVWVVADIPAAPPATALPTGVVNNDIIGVTLAAQAYALAADGGAALTDDKANADVNNAVQNVFADAAGATDAQYDGKHSAYGAYKVRTVELTLTKTSKVIWDPINLYGDGTTTFPKAIPGAVVEYCLLIQNPGALQATNLAITDAVPSNVTYYAGTTGTPTLAANLQGVTTGANATCGAATGQHGTSYGTYSSGTVTADFSQAPAVNLDPTDTAQGGTGTPLWVRFHVTFN